MLKVELLLRHIRGVVYGCVCVCVVNTLGDNVSPVVSWGGKKPSANTGLMWVWRGLRIWKWDLAENLADKSRNGLKECEVEFLFYIKYSK